MPGAREIGMMGAALALTGGVACAVCYLMRAHKPEKRAKDEQNKDKSEEERVHKTTKNSNTQKQPIIKEVCLLFAHLLREASVHQLMHRFTV